MPRVMHRVAMGIVMGLGVLATATAALAHGTTVMFISSTADGGGALKLDYDFGAVARLSYNTTILGVSLYSGTVPAFEPVATDAAAESSYVLDTSTQVRVEITGIDEGKVSMKLGAAPTLTTVGQSAVIGTMPFGHTHPQLQLQLALPEGEFGEGRISFRLTATGPTGYAPSAIYTLKLSNGPLPVPLLDAATEDTASVKCLTKAGKAVGKFASTKQSLLRKCLDKVVAARAKAALTVPPATLAAAQAKAEEACADATGAGADEKTMLGRIAAAQSVAKATIQKACGSAGSNDVTDDDIMQHLGLAGCRAEEIVAATYGTAKADLEAMPVRPSQGGDALSDHLPCLFNTATE